MIYYILKEDSKNEFGEKLGFNKNNTKILMYVFNSDYYSFLLEMLSFEINFNKFKNNKEEKAESFNNICNTFQAKKEKNKLINTIIRSDLPFIFIFIPNLLKVQLIKEKQKSELFQKVVILENEINCLKLKLEESEKTRKEMDEKIQKALKKYGIMID